VDLGILVGGLVAVHHDLVTRLPPGHAGPDLPDDAGAVGPADVMAVLGMIARSEDGDRLAERRPDVVVVDAGRHHPDDDLERAGLGNLDLLDLEGVDRLALALLADHPGGHRRRQRAWCEVEVHGWLEVSGHLG
jgi:hypothetical protein